VSAARRKPRSAAPAPPSPALRTARLNPGAADDALRGVLHAASLAVLKYPVAAQAAFAALVAEGRSFAETPEGRKWRDTLARSQLIHCGGALWAGSVLNTLEDHPGTLLPSTIVDAIAHVARRPDLTEFLQVLHREITEDDDGYDA
jgi:hypothetical protein